MDLADFIEANLEALIDDWAEYAMVLNQGKHRLTAVELRNSGAELLTRVAANMRQAQTPLQQRQNRMAPSASRTAPLTPFPCCTPTTACHRVRHQ